MQICREIFFFIGGGYPLLTTKTWKIFIILTQFVEFLKFSGDFFFFCRKYLSGHQGKKNKFWSFLTFRGVGGSLDQGLENSKLFFSNEPFPNYLKSSPNSKSKVTFKIACSQLFETVLIFDFWPSRNWDNWGQRHQGSFLVFTISCSYK